MRFPLLTSHSYILKKCQIVEPALSLLVNLVCPPSSIRDKQNDVLGELEQGFRQARQAVCANNGILGLLKLLQPRTVKANAHLCVLTCRVLIGLARDNTIANLLSKLQVCTLLDMSILFNSIAQLLVCICQFIPSVQF